MPVVIVIIVAVAIAVTYVVVIFVVVVAIVVTIVIAVTFPSSCLCLFDCCISVATAVVVIVISLPAPPSCAYMSQFMQANMTPTYCLTSRHSAMLPTWSVSCWRHCTDMSARLSFWGEKISCQVDRNWGISRSKLAAQLEITPANLSNNYWSPLSCLVEDQEENNVGHSAAKHQLKMSLTPAIMTARTTNKIAAKWKQKIMNRMAS